MNLRTLCAYTFMIALTAAAAGHAHAQGHGPAHPPGHAVPSAPRGDSSASSVALHAANLRMHEAMDVTFTGNVDVDFARSMIPHHQGAIDMAKVILSFSKDPTMRKLAEGIIKAQQEEIAWMSEWLKKNAP